VNKGMLTNPITPMINDSQAIILVPTRKAIADKISATNTVIIRTEYIGE